MKKHILTLCFLSAALADAQTIDSVSSENYSVFFDSIFQSQLDAKLFRGASFVFVKVGKVIYENIRI